MIFKTFFYYLFFFFFQVSNYHIDYQLDIFIFYIYSNIQ